MGPFDSQDLQQATPTEEPREVRAEREMREFVGDLFGTSRRAIVASVAARTGVPAHIVGLLSGSDAKELTQQAQAIALEMGAVAQGAPLMAEAGAFTRDDTLSGDEIETRNYVADLFGRPHPL